MIVNENSEFKNTINREVFNKLYKNKLLYCPYCAPNKGCNSRKKRKIKRNWKVYRKHKYK